jgi:hypothetical protein
VTLVWVPPAPAQSGEVTVEAEATPAEAGTEETVTYTIRVTGAALSAIETPEPPATTNLVLKQTTPSTERNLSFDSGSLSRSVTFRWSFRPLREGIARLKETAVTVKGETYTTEEVRLRIVPQSQRPQSTPSSPHGGARPNRSAPPPAGEVLDPQDLFIEATPDADRAYVNEQIAVEYRLFFRPGIQLRHSRLASAWDANGFWREELDVASRPVPNTRSINGRTYKTIVLKRVAVFPARAGTLRIEPLRIETEAYLSSQTSTRSHHSLRSRYEPVTLASDGLAIDARPLPDGAPPAFRGAVGQYEMDMQVSADSVEVGEAVRVKVRVKGAGNLATLQPPPFDPPSVFETYDPKVKTTVNRTGSAVRGTKTFTYVLVPRSNGTHTIPAAAFAYFDPEAGTYRTHRPDPVTIRVTGDAAPRAASTTGEGLPVGDIAGIANATPQWTATDAPPLHRRAWPYAAVLAPLVLAAGAVASLRRVRAGRDDDGPAAQATARTHLRQAREALRQEEVERFYRLLERAVLGIVAARTGRPVAGMTRPSIDGLLREQGVDPADREAFRELMEACDRAQYTPARPSADSMQEAYRRADELTERLDDALAAR